MLSYGFYLVATLLMGLGNSLGALQCWHFFFTSITLIAPCHQDRGTYLQELPDWEGQRGSREQGFSTSVAWVMLCYENCATYCRMLSSIPGLYPLNARSSSTRPTVWQTKKPTDIPKGPLGNKIITENYWHRRWFCVPRVSKVFLAFLWHFLHWSIITSLLVILIHR